MERKRRMAQYDEMGEIKKGPWKVEEDEVLINHVKKYGPRDWSSIRSKGLLHRTGKSCRLRWVNKLCPNLKTGVKFSAEEERTVIDLQAEFGNKWAKIATYLPGRTDNDVKNFWSSRQKRLARILQTATPSSSSSSSSSKPQISTKEAQPLIAALHALPRLQVPKLTSSTEKEFASKSQFCPYQNMVHPPPLVHQYSAPLLDYTPLGKKPLTPPHLISFPQFPLLQPDFPLLMESQDFITRHGDPSFLDEFEHSCGSVLGLPSFLGTAECQEIDSSIDDFPPMEIFDEIEALPSPSKWM